jgi:hypothetical protein
MMTEMRVPMCIGCPAISKETATRETAVQIEPRRVILVKCCSNGAQEYELYIGLMNDWRRSGQNGGKRRSEVVARLKENILTHLKEHFNLRDSKHIRRSVF